MLSNPVLTHFSCEVLKNSELKLLCIKHLKYVAGGPPGTRFGDHVLYKSL